MQSPANPVPDRRGHRTGPMPSKWTRKASVSGSICWGEISAMTSSAVIVCLIRYAIPTPGTNNTEPR